MLGLLPYAAGPKMGGGIPWLGGSGESAGKRILPLGVGEFGRGPSGPVGSTSFLSGSGAGGGDQARGLGRPPPPPSPPLRGLTPSTPPSESPFTYKKRQYLDKIGTFRLSQKFCYYN